MSDPLLFGWRAGRGTHRGPVVDRILRPLDGRRRMVLQILQRDGDGPFELRIVALTPGGGVELDLDVRRDAAIFHVKLAGIRIEEAPARRRDSAAINQI